MYRYLTRPSLAGVVATVALLALGFASILTPGWAANPGKPTVEPSPSEALELKATGTASLDAYDAYLLGLRHLNAMDVWRPDETRKARKVFEKAIALDPEFAVAQARHDTENAAAHDAYLQGWAHYKLLTPQSLAKAVPFFEEAIRLDPNYAQAHAALASLYWDVYQNDWAFDLDMPSTRAESRAN